MRKAHPDLIRIIEDRIEAPGVVLSMLALACVGDKEDGGPNRGRIVELFQDTIGRAEGEPWCLSFVQSLIAAIEEKNFERSPLPATEHCLTLWRDAPEASRLRTPEPGCIVVWQHAGTANGHVGIVIGAIGQSLVTVEGNTADTNPIERDGDGVFMRYRPRGGIGTMRELGFLRAF